MEGNTARALRNYTPRIGNDGGRRDQHARMNFLWRQRGFLRQPERSRKGAEMWNALLEDHDGDTASALGELVAVLVDAGLLGKERAV